MASGGVYTRRLKATERQPSSCRSLSFLSRCRHRGCVRILRGGEAERQRPLDRIFIAVGHHGTRRAGRMGWMAHRKWKEIKEESPEMLVS